MNRLHSFALAAAMFYFTDASAFSVDGLSKACYRADAQSCLDAGLLYQYGVGTNYDMLKAQMHFDVGCNLGDTTCCNALSKLRNEDSHIRFIKQQLYISPNHVNSSDNLTLRVSSVPPAFSSVDSVYKECPIVSRQNMDISLEEYPVKELNEYVDRGDFVRFGEYPKKDGKKSSPVLWYVAYTNHARALLISVKTIDSDVYDDTGSAMWSESSLRFKLNTDAVFKLFNPDEGKRICLSLVVNSEFGDSDSNDYIFILSEDEVERFIPCDLRAAQSGFSSENEDTLDVLGTSSWWLRNLPSDDGTTAMFVNAQGQIEKEGAPLSEKKHLRLAMWVNL